MLDNHDPQHAGEILAHFRKSHPDVPLHELADLMAWEVVRPYQEDKQSHSKKYQLELKQRAADGDLYAISLLAGQDGHVE